LGVATRDAETGERARRAINDGEDNESEYTRMPRADRGCGGLRIAQSERAFAHFSFGQGRSAQPNGGGARDAAASRNLDGSTSMAAGCGELAAVR
jgi:hypothetical protein